jgi:hypothetical protein
MKTSNDKAFIIGRQVLFLNGTALLCYSTKRAPIFIHRNWGGMN